MKRKIVITFTLQILLLMFVAIFGLLTLWKVGLMIDEPNKIDDNKKRYNTIRLISIFTCVTSVLITILVIYLWLVLTEISDNFNHLVSGGRVRFHPSVFEE